MYVETMGAIHWEGKHLSFAKDQNVHCALKKSKQMLIKVVLMSHSNEAQT